MDASGTFASFTSFESFGNTEAENADGNWCNGFEPFQSDVISNDVGNADNGPNENVWSADFQSFEGSEFSDCKKSTFQQLNEIVGENLTTDNSFLHFEENSFQQFEECTQMTNSKTLESNINSNTHSAKNSFLNFKSNLRRIFDFDELCVDETDDVDLEKSCKESNILKAIQKEVLDPIKTKKTLTHQLKVKQIESLLDSNKSKEDWLINVQECEMGIYRKMFDFHEDRNDKRKDNGNYTKNKHLTPQNGKLHKNIDSFSSKEARRYSNEKTMDAQAALEYNGTSQKLLELEAEMKKSFIDLSSRSVVELRKIVEELGVEAKIYSELLLSELDLREDLIRQQEVRNNFISKHLAVERKINELKKKKRSYGFFKYPEDDKTKILDWTIPYFTQEEGPTTTEITLLTELLSSIEKDDPETPRLISEYVFKLGNTYNLDTVIQVRTQDGIKTIDSPHGKTR